MRSNRRAGCSEGEGSNSDGSEGGCDGGGTGELNFGAGPGRSGVDVTGKSLVAGLESGVSVLAFDGLELSEGGGVYGIGQDGEGGESPTLGGIGGEITICTSSSLKITSSSVINDSNSQILQSFIASPGLGTSVSSGVVLPAESTAALGGISAFDTLFEDSEDALKSSGDIGGDDLEGVAVVQLLVGGISRLDCGSLLVSINPSHEGLEARVVTVDGEGVGSPVNS